MRRDVWDMRRGGVAVDPFRWGDMVEGGIEVRDGGGLIPGLRGSEGRR